jgi:thiamine-monophosphate kinase
MPEEEQIISIIKARARRTRGVAVGIGDDAAVLEAGGEKDLLSCCDLLVEGVHFERDWCDFRLLGRKSLAVNLSDIASMGGVPRFALASIALPPGCPIDSVESLVLGMLDLAEAEGVALVGGDTSASPGPLFVDVAVIGECERGRAIRRSGAAIGDGVYVSGLLGASALGLRLLKQGFRLTTPAAPDWIRDALTKHLIPQPRLELGRILGEKQLATAMIDISDGLSTDLARLLRESGRGAIIKADSLPVAGCLRAYDGSYGAVDLLDLALHGGEEYELLFTAGREFESVLSHFPSATPPITRIGEIVEGESLRIERNGVIEALEPAGYQHLI